MGDRRIKVFIGCASTSDEAVHKVSRKIASWIGDHVGPGQPKMVATSSDVQGFLGFFYISSCVVAYEVAES